MTAPSTPDLPALARAVRDGRAAVAVARARAPRSGIAAPAGEQMTLLIAMETYVSALASLGLPVPYRLHNDLDLYRAIFGIRGRPHVEPIGRAAACDSSQLGTG